MYLRALQCHSGCNLIDRTQQDNVIIQSNFFQYIYHVGCAINLHSIINSGLIPGCQILNNRQTVFFLPVDGQEDGVPRQVRNRRRRTREGPEPACVQTPFRQRRGTRRGGRLNQHPAVVPPSRRGNTSSESRRRENRAAQKG